MKKDWDYYRRLVTTEYRFAPKYIAMVKAITRFGLEVDNAAAEIVEAFDIDSAVGTQLDALGVILGVDRLLTFEPSMDSPLLDDEMYRLVLKCKIIKNHWDGRNQACMQPGKIYSRSFWRCRFRICRT